MHFVIKIFATDNQSLLYYKEIFLDLYNNMSEAREMPRGLVCVSVFVRLAESIYRKSNFEEFSKYLDRVSKKSLRT